jgi:hypothetical protein
VFAGGDCFVRAFEMKHPYSRASALSEQSGQAVEIVEHYTLPTTYK